MLRRHCMKGRELDDLYTQNTLAWGDAETRKRAAVCVASRAEWFEIARGAEEARAAYEKAKSDYIDHVIDCPVCEAHALACSADVGSVAYC
jgi:Arc/MetJ family transcription regulator